MELLGYTATDRISGFRGVLTGFCTYLTGCDQYLVQPTKGADDKVDGPRWIDEQCLILDPDAPRVVLDNGKTPGLAKPTPIR